MQQSPLLSIGMSLKGYIIGDIFIRIREDEVYYETYVDVVSKDNNINNFL